METPTLMTRAEIESAYPDEWVALADCELDENYLVAKARVLCHGRDHDLVSDALAAAGPRDGGLLFMGWEIPMPAGIGGFIL